MLGIRAVVLLTIVFVITGCGSGSSSGSSSNPPTSPAPSSELDSVSPSQLSFDIQSGDSVVANVTFANIGDGELSYELSSDHPQIDVAAGSGNLGAQGNANITVSLSCSGVDVNGNLTLATNDSDESEVNIPVAVACLPAPSYEISRITLNQAARSFDSNLSDAPSISILAGRDILVRAFVTGDGGIPDAQAVLTSAGNAQSFAMRLPPNVGASPADESILSASHFVVIPGSALSVGSTLRVEVSPTSNLVAYPLTGNIDLQVVNPGSFNITFVPVEFGGETPSIDGEQYLQQTRQQLPIGDYDIDVRSPYQFTGAYDLDVLMDEIADLRDLDGSGRLYHGVIVSPNQGSQTAGLGFVGFPVSVTIDLSGSQNVISHEIGHNLNLRHAPGCSAPNTDPDFPYADADVTSWGFDIVTNQLVEPTPTKKDLMSYCGDLWISDYHFNVALDHREGNSLGQTPGDLLLVSGRVNAGVVEELKVLPVLPVLGVTDASVGDYELVLWDKQGLRMSSARTKMIEIGDREGVASFRARMEGDLADIAHIELHHQGSVLFTQDFVRDPNVAAEVTWDASRLNVGWQPQRGDTLILRDADGVVRAMDRSGRLVVDQVVAGSILEIVQPGLGLQRTHLTSTGRDPIWLLDR